MKGKVVLLDRLCAGGRLGVYPLLRQADLRGMEKAGGEGTKGEAGALVDAQCGAAVGVQETKQARADSLK